MNTITIPVADYKRLLEASVLDDTIVRCWKCGAWLDLEEAATVTDEGDQGCWWAMTGREKDRSTCKMYRIIE